MHSSRSLEPMSNTCRPSGFRCVGEPRPAKQHAMHAHLNPLERNGSAVTAAGRTVHHGKFASAK